MRGLQGKNVLVTGASSGIGQAIAVRFAEEGASVAINYCRGEAGALETQRRIEATAAAVKSVVVQADVAVEADIDRMFETVFAELGGVDILINNAGFQIQGNSHEIPLSDFASVIATNLTGAFLCAQRAIAHMRAEEKPGVVINVSSVHEIIPKPGFAGYSASKGGMRNLTRTLALEYAPFGIRVNGLGPGATVTPMNEAWIDNPEKRAIVESHIPMGRSGTSEEMAAVTAFLCSDDASYITGQTLFVDGGITLFPEFGTPWSSS
ncbi:MAG: glucose 1-dehydrogenase [Planctomycetota bacterium]|nr:glucose 1-dehydrogenase [Planctomycetota bacterium]MDA1247971.1 glucose 1-dehydrogenase [Planctomycetota bacterium]